MIGETVSHYKVTEKLGEGGMGEVYRAEDTTLKREVALKVLPAEFTQEQGRLARFEREAQLLALLNHPNIAAIYGLEEANGVRFLVLELVEGETLAERLTSGPIAVKAEPEFDAAKPQLLFEGQYLTWRNAANYDISPDGKRFLMVQAVYPPTPINFVLNLSEEIKRLVPVDN